MTLFVMLRKELPLTICSEAEVLPPLPATNDVNVQFPSRKVESFGGHATSSIGIYRVFESAQPCAFVTETERTTLPKGPGRKWMEDVPAPEVMIPFVTVQE